MAVYGEGTALHKLGDYSGAAAALQKALALNPRAVDAWMDLGTAYLKMGNLEQAKDSYKRGLALDHNRPALHYSLGLAYLAGDLRAEAGEAFRRYLTLIPATKPPKRSRPRFFVLSP